MAFYVVKGAKEAGIDVGLILALDATVLKGEVALCAAAMRATRA